LIDKRIHYIQVQNDEHPKNVNNFLLAVLCKSPMATIFFFDCIVFQILNKLEMQFLSVFDFTHISRPFEGRIVLTFLIRTRNFYILLYPVFFNLYV
jgi:hypothetical protein